MTICVDHCTPVARPATLVELLRWRAATSPDQIAYIWHDDAAETQVSYGELDRRARLIAAWLQESGGTLSPVLICCPPGLGYLAALFGCWYAGASAIPSSAPESARAHRTIGRLQATIRNARPMIALTERAALATAASLFEQIPELQSVAWHAIDAVLTTSEQTWQMPALTGDTLAMLMYTSGSTGTPKGVMVSHANMLHNVAAFPGFEARPCRTIVSWLPLYHDLGLFLGVIHPLYRGVPAVLMDAATFVQRPLRWLEAMARYEATTTGAPNFAYDLCVRKSTPAQRAALDLQHWNMALNGAEPVRHDVLERFTAAFAPSGFRPETFYPSYGMSDATATVSGSMTFAPPTQLVADRQALQERRVEPGVGAGSRVLVGCGQPLPDQQLVIVDPETLQRAAVDQVGEIWLAGPSVTQGYWQQPDLTARTFGARLAGSSAGPFFRTGDLGFLHEDELFVVGRLHDMLIVRGQNHYPEDIELTVEACHPLLPPGGGAVFAVERDNEERLIVVHEVEPTASSYDLIVGQIRQAVAEQHGLQLYAVVLIKKSTLPRTSSGKIARQACKVAFTEHRLTVLHQWNTPLPRASADDTAVPVADTASPSQHTADGIAEWLVAQLAGLLMLTPAAIDHSAAFSRYGLDSVQALGLIAALESWLGRTLSPTLLWDQPTIAALAAHLTGTASVPAQPARGLVSQAQCEPIAIIGMGCRFPGASGLAGYWQLLRDGVDAITEVPAERWDVDAFYDPDRSAPGKMYSRWGGFLPDLHSADATFIGISPREAAHLDPQQRLLIEVAWEALEDAGQVPERLSGSPTGVFIGALGFDYWRIVMSDLQAIDAYSGTGTSHSILANRLSYMLNLRGPSITVDTACSGSLVALHLACQSLRSGETTLAIAGGVNVNLLPDGNVFFSKAGVLSPDGRCKTFDARANGIVRSDGAGAVVLKLLREAVADGDPIYAVIRGSAVNQDGRTNGIMAPSRQAQEAVLRAAYRQARIDPTQIQYIEAHGTGTSLGDVIEAQALGAVMAEGRAADQPCRIGSVKTNIGHTEAAAGIASVIKVALALKHGAIPATLHFQTPNPMIAFQDLRIEVQHTFAPWPTEARRLAGVSGFGFGGTNAHVVLEGFSAELPAAPVAARPHLLPLSAHTQAALRQAAQDYRALLNTASDDHLADVCSTASARRTHHTHRLALVAETRVELIDLLDAFLAGETRTGLAAGIKPIQPTRLVWVFSGQGSHWLGMGRALLEQEPVFAATLSRCDALLRQYVPWSLIAELSADEATSRLHKTEVAQPAIFAVQVALAALWRAWGITPDTIIGHSLGEIAAAHIAGAISLEDAVRIVYHRSQLMTRVAGRGATAAVELSREQAQLLLIGREDLLAIAGSNSPTSCILSGDPDELSRVLDSLERRSIFCRMLRGVDIAFHSPQMEPLKAELIAALADLQPQPTTIPLISTVTGKAIAGTALDATYWGHNLREPFLFADALRDLLAAGQSMFLEVSPHPVLIESIMRGSLYYGQPATGLASLRRNADERASLLTTLGTLYSLGATISWQHVADTGRCVQLPPFPWQRERYWMDQLQPGPVGDGTYTALIGRIGATTSRAGRIRSADAHPLLADHLHASLSGQHFWESDLSIAALPFLRDHQVQGMTVLPGAAYIEMGLAAAAVLPDAAYQLHDVVFKQALFVPPAAGCTLQVALAPAAGGAANFQIASRRSDSQEQTEWVIHAVGQLQPSDTPDASVASSDTPEQIRARCTVNISQAEHYQTMQASGLSYGPCFQAISEIWRRDGEALGQLQLPADLHTDTASYRVHPVLLDAAFQIVAATLPRAEHGSDPFLPVGIRSLRVHGKPGTQVWCHALLCSPLTNDAQRHEADLLLCDEAGRIVVEARGLQLQLLGAAAPSTATQPQDYLYTLNWQPQQGPTTAVPDGSWLIFADRSGVGQQLGEILRAGGARARLVYHDDVAVHDIDCQVIDPANDSEWAALIQETIGSAEAPYNQIAYLWTLDTPSIELLDAEYLAADQVLGCRNLVQLVQAIAQVQRPQMPQLWLVTAGGQAVDTSNNPIEIGQASVWGLGRVLIQEHPELRPRLVDLDPTLPGMSVSTLIQALGQTDREDQVAFRQGQRYVARLRPASALPAAAMPWHWRTDASYLITGGLGGLGLEVARWMVQQGARRLILLGRTPLPPRATWQQHDTESRSGQMIAAVRELESLGASVHVAAVDVADPSELATFLETYRSEGWPAIRGVVHAAGVLHDQLITRLEPAALTDVIGPKVVGAWLLHHLLRDQPLDFFVLFSSLASVLGSVGQSSYAAGNAFMDALAHLRHGQGRCATSINWGPWADIGMAARSGVNPQLAAQGMTPLLPRQGTAVLQHLLGCNAPQIVALAVDWKRWFEAGSQAGIGPLLAELQPQASPAPTTPAARPTFLADLRQAPAEARTTLLETHLQTLVARVLRVSSERLTPELPLRSFGLDSIMSIELRNSIELTTETTLSITYLLQGPSIAEITAALLCQISGDTQADKLSALVTEPELDNAALAQISDSDADRLAELLDQLEDLTSDEVQLLLSEG